MNIDDVKLLYDYNYWANRRLLEASIDVSEEQYFTWTPFGNLHRTLVHIISSEWRWRNGVQRYFVPADVLKASPTSEAKMWDIGDLTEDDLPTLEAIRTRWQSEEQAMRAVINGLSDSDLEGFVRYAVPEGYVRERVLWHVLYHSVNHGTQHRSEAAALLTSYGASPDAMDFTYFLNERAAQ